MLIPMSELVERHGLGGKITGILHIGANTGEEAQAYREAGVDRVVWIEALPSTIPALRAHVEPYGHEVIHAAVSDRAGQSVIFHVADNGQSSSLLEPKLHLKVSPDVHFNETITVETTTVDDLAVEHDFSGLNMANLDLQGAELMVLRGAEKTLEQIDVLYLEINTKELYKGCALLPELERFWEAHGFRRADLRMAGPNVGWGDCLAVRR